MTQRKKTFFLFPLFSAIFCLGMGAWAVAATPEGAGRWVLGAAMAIALALFAAMIVAWRKGRFGWGALSGTAGFVVTAGVMFMAMVLGAALGAFILVPFIFISPMPMLWKRNAMTKDEEGGEWKG